MFHSNIKDKTYQSKESPLLTNQRKAQHQEYKKNCQKQFYYSHKYDLFDTICENDDELHDTIRMYITKNKSTPDFEAEKYIAFGELTNLFFVLESFEMKDYKHLIATTIINGSDNDFLKIILHFHDIHKGYKCNINPKEDDLFYLALRSKNIHAFYSMLEYTNINLECKKMFDNSSYTYNDIDILNILIELDQWNRTDHTNPRNLVYALFEENISLALELIYNGCTVDMWNNYPMRYCIYTSNLKKDKNLCKTMLLYGAKIPDNIIQASRESRLFVDNFMKKALQ
jgi:hypothetical protein